MFLCTSYLDFNVPTIINKLQISKNSYYLKDDSVIISDDSATPEDPQLMLFDVNALRK